MRDTHTDDDCNSISNGHSYVYAYAHSPGHSYTYSYSASYGYTYRHACRLQHLHHGCWDWHNHGRHHRYRQPLR